MDTVLLAMLEEEVLLRIVEVGLELDSGVGLDVWSASRAHMYAVVLGSSLQYEALGDLYCRFSAELQERQALFSMNLTILTWSRA